MRRLRTSLRDIAKEAGVSHVTVSMVLRGSTRISEAQSLRIRQIAETMGYERDPMLSALAHYRFEKRRRVISGELALLNDWSAPAELYRYREFDAYLEAAADEAVRLGYHLQEYRLRKDNISTSRLQAILRARNTQGVLIPPHHGAFQAASLDWSRLSVVKLGHSVPRPRGQIVTSDQFRGGGLATGSLLALGFQRIGYVSNDLFEQTTGGRFQGGYLTHTLSLPQRLRLPPLVLKKAELLLDSGARRFKAWLGRVRPDAIIAGTGAEFIDRQIAKTPGLPPFCALSVPFGKASYYIDQHPGEVGRAAVRQLCAAIELRDTGEPEREHRVLVEPSWNVA